MKTKKILLLLIILIIGMSIATAADDNSIEDSTSDNLDNPLDNNMIESQNVEHDIMDTNTIPDSHSIENDKDTNPKKDSESKTIILNSSTFHEYITNEMFNDKVNTGDTIDIQGILDGNFTIKINKAVNVISSTHDGFINMERYSQSYGGGCNDFDILNEGSGTNISDIRLHNAHIILSDAHDITINNLTASCDMSVGKGSGMISIRDGSSHVTINNSYFETKNNQGHSNVVFCFAHDCLFENNTVVGHGYIGNLVYLTTYGGVDSTGQIDQEYGNTNITIRNNIINGMDVDPQSPICVGLVYEGANHTFANNTILRGSRTTMLQYNDYGTSVYNITFENNYIPFPGRDYITDANINSYGTLDVDGVYTLANDTSNKSFIINATNISTVINNYGSRINALSTNIHTYIANYVDDQTYKIENLYAPNSTVIINRPLNITNSIIKQLIVNTSANITNNTIINKLNNTIISNNPSNDTLIKDNYLICYNEDNITYGDDTIESVNATTINNGPELDGIHYLTNENYPSLFNEDYTLKDDITGTIIALENITNPVIINKAINLITAPNINTNYSIVNNLHSHSGKNPVEDYFGQYIYCHTFDAEYYKINGPIYSYSNITFLSGSENSNVTNIIAQNIQLKTNNITIVNSSLYGKIMANNSNNSNIITNVLFGNDSSVTLTNSNNNTLKMNIIENKEEYTIKLDETSTNNIITDNNLTTNTHKGDFSIQYPANNIIQDNMPLTQVNITIETNTTRVTYVRNISDSTKDIEFDTLTPGKAYELRININSDEEVIPRGYALVLFNGTQIGKYELINGYAQTELVATDLNQQYLRVWYLPEDGLYEMTSATKLVNLIGLNTTTTIEANSTKTGEVIHITATVIDSDNDPVKNGTLTFIVNNTQHNVSITDGVAIFTATTNESWASGVYAIYNQTEIFNQSRSNTIKLEKGDAIINTVQKIENDKYVIKVYVTDINENPIGGYIKFKNQTMTNNTKINNGTVTLELPLSSITENQQLTVNFTNNNMFNPQSQNITLTLNPPSITQVQLEEINGKVGQPTTITATVTTEDDSPVNEGTVTFTTTDYTETINVVNGIATTTHTFTQKLNNILKAKYAPTNTQNYYESTNTTTIIISKDPKNITINIEEITGKINKKTEITATVTTTDGTTVNEGTVTFTTTNYRQTVPVTESTATTIHIFTEALTDILEITYTPENPEDYNPQSTTTTITITDKADYTLKIDTKNLTINQTNTIKATIFTDETIASNLNSGKIVFKINGKTLKDTNGKVIYAKVTNGTAQIEYLIPETMTDKEITLTATYSGSSQCPSIKNNTTINLNKKQPTLTITSPTTVTTNSNITVNASITYNNTPITTGKIVFKINGKTIKDTNGKVIYLNLTETGNVTLNYNIGNLKAKTYTITAVFISNAYERIEKSETFTVVNEN